MKAAASAQQRKIPGGKIKTRLCSATEHMSSLALAVKTGTFQNKANHKTSLHIFAKKQHKMVQILTFFCKNNLCLYIAKEKYKIRGDKSDYISKYQVLPYYQCSNPISSVQLELSRQHSYSTSQISHFIIRGEKFQKYFSKIFKNSQNF